MYYVYIILVTLLMREFSLGIHEKNTKETKFFPIYPNDVFYRYFCIFVSLQAETVNYWWNFIGRTLAMSIMIFYPLHQTFGQLSVGSFSIRSN